MKGARMRRKLVSIGTVLLALALLFTLAPACGNGGEEPEITTTPPTSEAAQNFQITVFNDPHHPDWNWVTVSVFCTLDERHHDLEVNSATIAVSFPDISDVTNVVFYHSSALSHKWPYNEQVYRG